MKYILTYVEGAIHGKFRCKVELQSSEKMSKDIEVC